jgi:hypothetical protein
VIDNASAMSELTDLAAHELGAAIGAGDASCRDVMQAFLDRIAALNPRHNAIVSLRDGDELLLEADRADLERARHGPGEPALPFLFGLPQAIKDMVPTAGIRTTSGSPLFKDFVPGADSLLVQRMKAAGCIVIGKTNTPSSASARTASTRCSARPATPSIRPARRAARAAAPRSRWRRGCCPSPTAATPWGACATRPAGTTCSAFARARAGCRTGPRATSGSAISAPRGRWRGTCATSPCCSTSRPATTPACRSRSRPSRRSRRA